MPPLPIHLAANTGDIEEIKTLVEQDPQVVHRRDSNGCTPLHYASYKGHIEAAELLLLHGSRINDLSTWKETPLFVACRENRICVVELLLAKGADASLANHRGVTPLIQASRSSDVKVVKCLLQHHQVVSTVNCRDDYDQTVLFCTPFNWGHCHIVQLALEAGADPTLADKEGQTAMDMAKDRCHHSCLVLLQEWYRSYALAKARSLYDAYHSTDLHSITPAYLKGRVEEGEGLPKVEVDVARLEVVGAVLEYVICGGLKGELFVELMELMGRTGVRDAEIKKVERAFLW